MEQKEKNLKGDREKFKEKASVLIQAHKNRLDWGILKHEFSTAVNKIRVADENL